jgi:ribosomal protein S18 acetylase RimI-like enzyme
MPQLVDLDIVRRRLERDRQWSAFALADLDAPYAQFANWYGLADGDAVVLVYTAFDPPIIFCLGEPAECEAVLQEPAVYARTTHAYVESSQALMPVIQRQFGMFDHHQMSRMVLHGEPPPTRQSNAVVRLGPADLDAVRLLYSNEPPAFFLPEQLRYGVYFGVRDSGALAAVAGTHVVSTRGSVAAIGNVYTRPDCRGRGLAAEVTAAVARELKQMVIETIVLNVAAANTSARRVYERLGFTEYCVFHEGPARR